MELNDGSIEHTTFYICRKQCGRLFKISLERDLHQNECDGSLVSTEEILNKMLSEGN